MESAETKPVLRWVIEPELPPPYQMEAPAPPPIPVAAPERVPPAAVAVPGGVFLVLVGAVGYADAEQAVRQIAPTVGFLVVVAVVFWAVGRGHAIHTGPVITGGVQAAPAAGD